MFAVRQRRALGNPVCADVYWMLIGRSAEGGSDLRERLVRDLVSMSERVSP